MHTPTKSGAHSSLPEQPPTPTAPYCDPRCCRSGAKRPWEGGDGGGRAAADPEAALAAGAPQGEVKGRLLQMESEFRAQRTQQAAVAAHAADKERGAGDWAAYQPPSAVLQAVAAKQQQQQQQAVPATAPAAAPAAGGARELPPALRARLAARGILPAGDAPSAGGGGAGAAAAAPAAVAAGQGPLPPGWYQATDPQYRQTYYYCPATGERSWTRPQAPVRAGGGLRWWLRCRRPWP